MASQTELFGTPAGVSADQVQLSQLHPLSVALHLSLVEPLGLGQGDTDSHTAKLWNMDVDTCADRQQPKGARVSRAPARRYKTVLAAILPA